MENNQSRNDGSNSHDSENQPWTPEYQKPSLKEDPKENHTPENQKSSNDNDPGSFPDEFETPGTRPPDSVSIPQGDNPENPDDENDDEVFEEEGDFEEKDNDYRDKKERNSFDRNSNP